MAAPDTGPLLRRIGGLLSPYRGQLVLVAVTIVVGSGLGIITPFLTQAVFDRALFPVDGGPVDLPLLYGLVAAMVAVPLLSAGIGVGQTYLTTTVGNRAMADLRGRLFEHLERMELAFFTATKTRAIQSRLANDVAGVRTVLTDTLGFTTAFQYDLLGRQIATIDASMSRTPGRFRRLATRPRGARRTGANTCAKRADSS